MSMDQQQIDALGASIVMAAQVSEPRGDALAAIFTGMGLERGDRVVTADWGKPFICPTTGNTILWIQRPGYDGFIKVTFQAEKRPAYKPMCGIAT